MRTKLLLFLIFVSGIVVGQEYNKEYFKRKYDTIISGNSEPSLNRMIEYTNSNNSYHFMALGYFFNANNLMYKETKDTKYLNYNLEVLNSLIFDKNSKGNYVLNKWPIKVAQKHMSASYNDQESLVYEGYFFRYLAEFYDIIISQDLFGDRQQEIKQALEYAFNKWSEPSMKNFGDYSSVQHLRLHIGSHWATVAMYLNKHTKKKEYLAFYTAFNSQVKKALKRQSKSGNICYVWNSTYPERFNLALRRRSSYDPVLQDVSHGNHVVQFILDSYNLGYGRWGKNDIQYLSNTVKYLLWQPKTKSFADMVDGTRSIDKTFVGEGWKQSDGWMKLVFFDNSLKDIYQAFYKENEERITSKFQSLQTLAVLYCS